MDGRTTEPVGSGSDIADFLAKTKNTDTAEVPEKTDKKTHKRKERALRKDKTKQQTKKLLLLGGAVLLVGGLLFFVFRAHVSEAKIDQAAVAELESDKIYYSTLTGLEVAKPEITTAAATCVMIENSPDARPQSGLAEAGVVYEAVAEGGITRFMAIFQEAKPQFIGPVRSLRIAYAEMAKPYHCSLLHMGGADNAIGLVRNNPEFRDLEGMWYENRYVWRHSSPIAGKRRYAPHNVYTSFEKLDALNFNKGYNESKFSGFARVSPDQPPVATEQTATTIKVNMSSPLFNPIFTYHPESNTYSRAHANGGPHLSIASDGKALNITPTVVIAMKVNGYTRPGPDRYTDYVTTGEGEAFVFQNGGVTTGTWKRENANAELNFYDNEGQIIKLNRGQTWISMYPNGRNVEWQ
ncbi:DUF3048 domain-containing protein [Candidatus Saccharibacteria bacterium]|nr:DUF3048 domain-containing protein [Candidatus Saccharibacteria bacterium]